MRHLRDWRNWMVAAGWLYANLWAFSMSFTPIAAIAFCVLESALCVAALILIHKGKL